MNFNADDEFYIILDDILKNESVLRMNDYLQHYDTTCYSHCLEVAYYTYNYCKKHKLDYISATRAAMLHDLFLYDWRIKQLDRKRLHAFRHPQIAFDNASKLFELNTLQKDIMVKHMWPLTVILPKYKESYVVSVADKYCTLKESFEHYKHNFKLQKLYRYGYVFLSLLVIKVM